MKLSEVHKELLSNMYPNGYVVPGGEEKHYHVMFVDILNQKGVRSQDRAMIQKFFPVEWDRIQRAIEKEGIGITGHNEFAVIHDPRQVKSGPKPEPETEHPVKSDVQAKKPVRRKAPQKASK